MEGREKREGFLLLLYGFILWDYHRAEHLLFLYVGISGSGKIYSSCIDSFYVSGYSRGGKNLRSGGDYKCKDGEMDLSGDYGVCDGGLWV